MNRQAGFLRPGIVLNVSPGLGFWVVQENEETSLTYRGAALIAVFRVVHSSLVTGTMSCLKYHQK